MSCRACGHRAAGIPVRTFIDVLRRRPAVLTCPVLDDEGGGNGLAGGNALCGCTDPDHADPENTSSD